MHASVREIMQDIRVVVKSLVPSLVRKPGAFIAQGDLQDHQFHYVRYSHLNVSMFDLCFLPEENLPTAANPKEVV